MMLHACCKGHSDKAQYSTDEASAWRGTGERQVMLTLLF